VEPVAAEVSQPESEPELQPETEPDAAPKRPRSRGRAPRIHVPASDLGATSDDGDVADNGAGAAVVVDETAVATESETGESPTKKKTRRGTRGGRSRKRKPAAESGPNGDEPVAEPAAEPEVEPAASTEGEFGYVPMSEWLDDLERR
jgi:hypothetical protein